MKPAPVKVILVPLMGSGPTMASQRARKQLGVKPRGFIQVRNLDRDTVLVRQVRRLPASLLPESDEEEGTAVIFMPYDDFRLLCLQENDTIEAQRTSDTIEVP